MRSPHETLQACFHPYSRSEDGKPQDAKTPSKRFNPDTAKPLLET